MSREQAKENLLKLKQEIADRLEKTHKHIHGREERVSANFSEQSVEMDNQELVMNLDAEGREELQQIEAALARLESGAYGTCTGCGETISDARLEALPFTAICIDCAAGAEV